MKINWQIKKLNEICTVFADGDWIESKDQSAEGIRLIQTGNIGNGIFKDRAEKARYISEKTFKRLHCTEVLSGDCLISRLPDPVGRSCIIPKLNEKLITAVDCTIARFSDDVIPQWFVYYSLTNKYQQEINEQVTGSTRQRITRKNLGQINVPVTTIPEQKRIIGVLDDVFKSIEKVKEDTENSLRNAKEIFNSYLENIDGQKQSLGSVVEIKTGKLNANAMKEGGKYPFFTCAKEIYAIDKYSFDCEAVLLAGNNAVGDFNVKHYKGKFDAYQRTYVITVNSDNKILYRYLYYQLLKSLKEFKGKSVGAGTKFLKIGMIQDLQIAIPSLEKQKLIIKKLDEISEQTTKLELIYHKKLIDLRDLKKSFLKEAFEGKFVVQEQTASLPVPSPYIRNQVHAAIVGQVSKDGGETTEVAVAKYDHLLQEIFGVSLGYQFQTHLFGPFDVTIKKLVSSGLSPTNKWFTKRNGMIVAGSNMTALLSRSSNLYKSAQSAMGELARLGITKMSTNKVELLSTVCHAIKETHSTDVQQIRNFMSQWQTNNNQTKAQKFSLDETTKCVAFIIKNGLDKKIA